MGAFGAPTEKPTQLFGTWLGPEFKHERVISMIGPWYLMECTSTSACYPPFNCAQANVGPHDQEVDKEAKGQTAEAQKNHEDTYGEKDY